jgi:osmotically-inducible protein OsmY
MMDDDVDPSAMGVQVVNGEVILTGTVSSRFEKRLAEHLADSVPGVTDVDNRLKIGKLEAAPQAPAGNAITGVHA